MKANKTMKALQFSQVGDPATVLSLQQLPLPEPAAREVRVRILASPIHPADLLFVEGKYRRKPVLPQIAGLEAAGIIEKAGNQVALLTGTRVAFRYHSAWSEYAVVPVDQLIPLPEHFPIEKACQLSLNPVTAYGLLEEAKLSSHDWLAITAGNSSIATLLLQLAKRRKINTLLLVRKVNETEKEDLLRLGADAVLEVGADDLLENIHRLTASKGINCVMDAVGGSTITKLLPAIAQGGIILSYGILSPENVSFHYADLIFKNLTIKGFGIDHWLQSLSKETKEAMYTSLMETMLLPDFTMPVGKHFALHDFRSAFDDFVAGAKGKLLLIPG